MDQNLGCLSHYRYIEHLPLLGAFVIASNEIVKPVSGFTLYNATDGIVATDIASWFSRWINSQHFSWNSSCLHISPIPQVDKKRHRASEIISYVLGFVVMSTTMIIAVLSEDWWGFVNSISMIISILSRAIVINENRKAINAAYTKVEQEDWAKIYKKSLISPDGKAITIFAPCGIITEVLLTNPRPHSPRLYLFARSIGWAGFAAHVVSLGMAILVNQLITVALLLIATILIANGVGCDKVHISYQIQAERFDETRGSESRSRAYLRMDLSRREEDAMLAWGLFPRRTNENWWVRYRGGKAETGRAAFDEWKGGFWKPTSTTVDKSEVTVRKRAYSV